MRKQKQVKPTKGHLTKKKSEGELTENDLKQVSGGTTASVLSGGNVTAKYDLVKAKGA